MTETVESEPRSPLARIGRERLMLASCPALALMAPLVEAYGTLGIPLFVWPSAVIAGSLAAVGIVLGALAAWIMPTTSSRPVRDGVFCAVLSVSALIVLDVSAGGHALLTAAAPGSRMARLAVLSVAFSGLSGLFWMVRRRVVPVLFITCVVFLGSTLAMNASVLVNRSDAPPPEPAPAANGDGPPFLYVVLDEAMGVEGLKVAPGGQVLAAELRELFTRHGFRVHGGAFSRHFVSGRSIPNTLNFDFRDDSWGPVLRYHTGKKVASALFRALAREYRVISYGTAHVDFCFAEAQRCEILPSFNPFSPYIEASRRARALFRVMWATFTESYLMYRLGGFLVSAFGDEPVPGFSGVDAYAFTRWFDRFAADVLRQPRGSAYFAHLLMPHAPYVFDEQCRETGRATVAYFLAEDHGLSGAALDRVREATYRDYLAQYRCLMGRLERLLARIDRDPRFADATIVIHGDHGARISAGQYAESLSARDLVDNYSALYAIRSPRVEPGYDTRVTSVQRLTAEYFGDGPLGPDNPTVAVDSRQEGRVMVLPMPDPTAVAAGMPAPGAPAESRLTTR